MALILIVCQKNFVLRVYLHSLRVSISNRIIFVHFFYGHVVVQEHILQTLVGIQTSDGELVDLLGVDAELLVVVEVEYHANQVAEGQHHAN